MSLRPESAGLSVAVTRIARSAPVCDFITRENAPVPVWMMEAVTPILAAFIWSRTSDSVSAPLATVSEVELIALFAEKLPEAQVQIKI